MHGVTHLVVPAIDLDASARFYEHAVLLTVLDRTENWVDLDTGGVALRLLRVGADERRPVELRLSTGDMEVDRDAFLAEGGAEIHPARICASGETLEAEFEDPAGNRLTLWRTLGEDELEVPPELVVSLPWTEGARDVLNRLLRHVPEGFRDIARKASVMCAEDVAGSGEVDADEAIRGHVQATPSFMHERLEKSLGAEGVDPARYLPVPLSED